MKRFGQPVNQSSLTGNGEFDTYLQPRWHSLPTTRLTFFGTRARPHPPMLLAPARQLKHLQMSSIHAGSHRLCAEADLFESHSAVSNQPPVCKSTSFLVSPITQLEHSYTQGAQYDTEQPTRIVGACPLTKQMSAED